jgi:hypothetical protein
MYLFGRFVSLFFAVLAVITLQFVPTAAAQTPSQASSQASSEGGWHVGISPYLWFAGIHGTVGALGKEASVHATFGDIFSQLNIGLMSAVETRHNRIVMPVDFIWLNLSDEQTLTPGLRITSVGGCPGRRKNAGKADAETRHHDSGRYGGGDANSDYQAAGLLGYELNKKWSLSGGYRYMAVNYRPNSNLGFVDDTATSGIILGATWNIK